MSDRNFSFVVLFLFCNERSQSLLGFVICSSMFLGLSHDSLHTEGRTGFSWVLFCLLIILSNRQMMVLGVVICVLRFE